MGYEEDNALEWATPDEVAAHFRRKEKAAAAAASQSIPQWSQVASLAKPPTSGQLQIRVGPGPDSSRHSQRPNYAAAAGARSGNATPIRQLTPNREPSSQVGHPPPGLANNQLRPQSAVPRPSTQLVNAGPSVPSQKSQAAQNDAAMVHGAQGIPQPQSGRAAPPRRRVGLHHDSGSKGTPNGRHFARVRPENDPFGKDEARRKKEEKKKLALIENQAAGEDEFGHRGVFVLGDQIAADPAAFVRKLKEYAQHRKCNVFFSRESSIVEVIAEDTATVQLILSSARNMVVSASTTQEHIQLILVDSPAPRVDVGATSLRMISAWDHDAMPQAAGLSLPKTARKMYPVLLDAASKMASRRAEETQFRRNTFAMQFATTQALGKLQYFKGNVTMRINFGALVFQQYRWEQGQEKQDTASFVQNLRHANTWADLYKLTSGSELFARFASAESLLAPFRGGTVALTTPSFTGCFVWMTGDKADRIYEVTTEPITRGKQAPGVVKRGWMPPNAPGTRRSLSVFLTQLNNGISCALQIHTEEEFVQPTDTPVGLTAQVTKPLHCDDYEKSAGRGELMFDWRSSGCADFRQRTTWRYRLGTDMAYVVEIVRYDGYNRDKSVLDRRPRETRWDVSLYHELWEEKFAANISIKPGEKTYWDADIETFFPTENPDAKKETGTPAGFVLVIKWIRDFLDCLNAKERQAILRR